MNDETDIKWNPAVEVEISSMEKHDVWYLVPRKQGMDIVRSICQKPNRLKARLVAVSNDQKNLIFTALSICLLRIW